MSITDAYKWMVEEAGKATSDGKRLFADPRPDTRVKAGEHYARAQALLDAASMLKKCVPDQAQWINSPDKASSAADLLADLDRLCVHVDTEQEPNRFEQFFEKVKERVVREQVEHAKRELFENLQEKDPVLIMDQLDFPLAAVAVRVGLDTGVLNMAYSHIFAAEMTKQSEAGGNTFPVEMKLPRLMWEKLFGSLAGMLVLAVWESDEDMERIMALMGRIEEVAGPMGEPTENGGVILKMPGYRK